MHPEDQENTLMQSILAASKSVAEKTGGKLLLLHTYELLEEVNLWAKLEFKPLKVPMEELDQKMQAAGRTRCATRR